MPCTTKRMRRRLALVRLLIAGAAVATLSPRLLTADTMGRGHTLHRIDPRAAETWAWELCERLARSRRCQVQSANEDELVVFGPDDVHAAVVRMLAERDPATRPTRTFHVVLLAASSTGPPGIEGTLARPARDALDDVRAYLPFRRFAVLGTASVRLDGHGVARVSGSDGAIYEIDLRYERAIVRLEGLELFVSLQARHIEQRESKASSARNARLLLDSRLAVADQETVVVGHVQASPEGPALMAVLTIQP